MENSWLHTLLAPITAEAFLRSHWPGEPLYVPPSAGKHPRLFGLPALQSLEALVAGRTAKVRACLPDFDDEYSSIFVEPGDAPKVFRNHMTLVFDALQTQCPVIAEALAQLRAELGLPVGSDGEDLSQARANGYVTPAGGRTRLHFDANANFVLQIRGTKRWGLAPNTSVENPTDRYTSGSGEIAVALEEQCHAMLLEELPAGSREVLMEPGAVLFVPRGYWHETSAEEDSISLSLTFGQPTWADVVAREIHETLSRSAEWRGLANEAGLGEMRARVLAELAK